MKENELPPPDWLVQWCKKLYDDGYKIEFVLPDDFDEVLDKADNMKMTLRNDYFIKDKDNNGD